MEVIMLDGPGSCGKTTTLNLVYSELTTIHGATVHTNKTPLGGNQQDFEVILNYNGKTVAIFTMGDFSNMIINAMNKYARLVNVLVIACNNRFRNPYIAIQAYKNIILHKPKGNPASDQLFTDNIISLL